MTDPRPDNGEIVARFTDDWLGFERQHAWHPYASVPAAVPPLPVESASGVRLRLSGGTELVDGMSSWWSAIHGYSHPVINAALIEQLGRMSHVMFGGLTHRPAAELIRRLVAMTPEGLEKVFLCDSGSVSVEVAMKMACQYQQARGYHDRTRFASFSRGYHGDTIGAMSISDPQNGMHSLFTGLLAEQLHLPAPPSAANGPFEPEQFAPTAAILERHADRLAAVVVEPILQGAGGMRIYQPDYLRSLADACRRLDLLLVVDEIATGFGRTGALFASDAAGVHPDIMCVGKALTGGTMTLAATLCTTEIAETICGNTPGVFMHGPTFMANPLACAAAIASIDLLEAAEPGWKEQVDAIESAFAEFLAPAEEIPGVVDVRVLGAVGVIEMSDPVDMRAATACLLDSGVWLRPFGRLIYAMPPYISSRDDLERISGAMLRIARL